MQASLLRTVATAAAAAAISAAFAGAQVVNDECVNAVPVTLGVNGPFSNVGSTTSVPWPCASGDNDVWFIYNSTCSGNLIINTCGADYDTCIEAFDGDCNNLVSLACNDDVCGRQSEISFAATRGNTYFIRVGGWTGETGNFPLTLRCDFDLFVAGVGEAMPGAGTLDRVGSRFRDGWDLRWNFEDPSGIHAGKFGAMIVNVGVGGSSPIGVTQGIPGFDQVWTGSNPTAAPPQIFGPYQVGQPDFSVTIPPLLFGLGDTVRVQGLVLDATAAAGVLPVIATTNTVEFAYELVLPCTQTEDFDSLPTGTAGTYPTGWSNGGGTQEWLVDAAGTPSSGTGPSAAFSGANYMYCETSFLSGGDTWVMNTDVYPDTLFNFDAISFQLSRVGATIGQLEVRMGDGSGTFPTVVASYTGSAAGEWNLETVLLPTPLPANVQFQFHYSYGGSFTGDIAIDDFCIN